SCGRQEAAQDQGTWTRAGGRIFLDAAFGGTARSGTARSACEGSDRSSRSGECLYRSRAEACEGTARSAFPRDEVAHQGNGPERALPRAWLLVPLQVRAGAGISDPCAPQG